jgi:6-phosphogluconolactonase
MTLQVNTTQIPMNSIAAYPMINNPQKIFHNLTRTFLLIGAMAMSSCDAEMSDEHQAVSYSFLVGSYTDAEDQGIGLLSFDPENGVLTHKVIAPGVKNPSFVITDQAGKTIYAVEETDGGNVRSFEWDTATKTLVPKQTIGSFGGSPCYLSLSPKEDFLVVGNYSGGNFSAYAIEDDGLLSHVQTFDHEGQSINVSRQEKAHVHSTVFHPNGKQLLVGDLGTDKIHIYNYQPDFAVPFAPSQPPYLEVSAGAGPRHLVVHPSGNRIYLVHELTAELGVYDFNSLKKMQALTLTSDDFVGDVGAAEVRMSPDSKFVYVSNRGDANEITVFKADKDGNLEFVERVNTGGEMPRNFNFTADGEYLLVAHQASGDVVVFKRDIKSGKLQQTEYMTSINKPVYLFALR